MIQSFSIGNDPASARRRRVVAGALIAFLVTLPLTACATGGEAGVGAAPSGAAVPSSAPGTSASSSAAPSASAAGGRIEEATLKQSLLTMPSFMNNTAVFCPAGDYRFTDGEAPNKQPPYTLEIEKVVYADVDEDGAEETIALMICWIGQAGEYRVMAFDRDASGAIDTLGTVVAADLKDKPDGSIVNMRDIKADGKAIAVEVGDRFVCCGGNPDSVQWQWRSYALSGGEFTQVSGEKAFPGFS